MPASRSNRLMLILLLLFEPEWHALNGRAALGRVFWVYGVLVSAFLSLLYLLAREARRADLQQLLLVILLAYTAAILVAVWRCGPNAAPPWGLLARALTIVWAINTLLLIGFLEIDLIATWLKGTAS